MHDWHAIKIKAPLETKRTFQNKEKSVFRGQIGGNGKNIREFFFKSDPSTVETLLNTFPQEKIFFRPKKKVGGSWEWRYRKKFILRRPRDNQNTFRVSDNFDCNCLVAPLF